MGRYQRVKSDGEFGECEGELEGKAMKAMETRMPELNVDVLLGISGHVFN